MAINYTAINPVTATLNTTGGFTEVPDGDTVTVIAFGWADADPETATGVWVLGHTQGQVAFVPTSGIGSLKPGNPPLETALEQTRQTAATAAELANKLDVKVAGLQGTREWAGRALDLANQLNAKVAGLEPTREVAEHARDLAGDLNLKVAGFEPTREIAISALDLASKLRVIVAGLTQEVHVAEEVTALAMDVSLETAEEVKRTKKDTAANRGTGRRAPKGNSQQKVK